MNTRLTEIYRSCRSREGLASQDEYKSANVLLGTEVEKFAELIVKEMLQTCEDHPAWTGRMIGEQIKEHFGVES